MKLKSKPNFKKEQKYTEDENLGKKVKQKKSERDECRKFDWRTVQY